MQLLMSASERYQHGDFDQAQALAERALKADPRSGDAHTLLGVIAETRGDARTAGVHYGKAVEIAPRNGLYANNHGNWLCANGRPVESLAWFDRAIADPAFPARAQAMANAGGCALKAGQPEQAEANWRGALALDPRTGSALSGMARMKFASGEYLGARAFTERWLALLPDDPEGLRLAAQVEQKLGDNAAASRYLSRLQAIPSGPGSAPRTQ
ncbi:MAG TPA: tetratricopeptide repeat protein [Thermomonas sp.]|nr:tetratricopeptide repeat protein [Thermomonas sp.]